MRSCSASPRSLICEPACIWTFSLPLSTHWQGNNTPRPPPIPESKDTDFSYSHANFDGRRSSSNERKVLAPVTSAWLDGVQHTNLVTAIGAEQGHLPLLIAVRPRSGRYARLSIEEQVTSDFMAHWLVEATAAVYEFSGHRMHAVAKS